MIRFKGTAIDEREVIEFLRQKMLLKDICQQIVAQKAIGLKCAEQEISLTPEEIQIECDSIRYNQRLERVSDTLAWLEDKMLSIDDWEAAITHRLQAQKLAKELFAGEVEKHFAQNRLSFDRFVLYQIVVPFEPLAREIFYQIEEQEISFYEAAHVYDIDEKRRNVCGYEGIVHRWSFPPDIAAVIFKTPLAIGEVLGPVKSDQGYHLFIIEQYLQAELTPQVAEGIIAQFFQSWLTKEIEHLAYNAVDPSESIEVVASSTPASA